MSAASGATTSAAAASKPTRSRKAPTSATSAPGTDEPLTFSGPPRNKNRSAGGRKGRTLGARVMGRDAQPVNAITWVHRDDLHANNYNPNHVAPPELELLITSILEDGWTQPIVAQPDGEIVDGFHRWTVSGDPRVYAMTEGFVPVVRLSGVGTDHQMMSTIRHNRARGMHAVLPMADIVRRLIDDEGLSRAEVQARLAMESEEVDRLYDRSGMTKRGSRADFNHGWIPG
jgi:hypothetical protein